MNPLNFIVQGINQLKLTDIFILVLLVFAIIDFHWHIKKSVAKTESVNNKKTGEEDSIRADKENIFLTWDYKLGKPILSVHIRKDEYLLFTLDKEEATTLLEQLKSFQDNKEKNKINILDPQRNKNIHGDTKNLNKNKIEIPITLYKQYQKNEVKLEKLESFIKKNKKSAK